MELSGVRQDLRRLEVLPAGSVGRRDSSTGQCHDGTVSIHAEP